MEYGQWFILFIGVIKYIEGDITHPNYRDKHFKVLIALIHLLDTAIINNNTYIGRIW